MTLELNLLGMICSHTSVWFNSNLLWTTIFQLQVYVTGSSMFQDHQVPTTIRVLLNKQTASGQILYSEYYFEIFQARTYKILLQ